MDDNIALDTITINANYSSYEKMVSKIVLNDNFKYRTALRKSKISKREFLFLERRITKTELLKHLKEQRKNQLR